MRTLGRRLRRDYLWIPMIQTLACFGKITVHPIEPSSFADLVERATVGPIPVQWELRLRPLR